MNKTSEALFRLDSRGIPAREPHSRQAWGEWGAGSRPIGSPERERSDLVPGRASS